MPIVLVASHEHAGVSLQVRWQCASQCKATKSIFSKCESNKNVGQTVNILTCSDLQLSCIAAYKLTPYLVTHSVAVPMIRGHTRLVRVTLCTIDLRCAPLTCIVHQGAQGGPMFVRSIVFLWLTTNMQIKVHNVVLYRQTLWWCTM